MAILHPICGTEDDDRLADVVFVHGLNPNFPDTRLFAFDTWGGKDANSDFWPKWLHDDLQTRKSEPIPIGVWVAQYDSAATEWLGHSMPLPMRAANFLDALYGAHLGTRPILFIAHSLGGLVVKEVLRRGLTENKADWVPIAKSVCGIVFFATPHAGADLASFLGKLRTALRLTKSVSDLEANSETLQELSEWFRDNALQNGIDTRSYCESLKTDGVLVVDRVSANPQVPYRSVIPLDKDHGGVAKIVSVNDQPFASVSRFVEERLQALKQLDLEALEGESNAAHVPGKHIGISTTPDKVEGVDRERLVSVLQSLDSLSLTRIVNRLDQGANYDSPYLPVALRLQGLLAWIEGAAGPGLQTLGAVVAEEFPPTLPSFSDQPGVSRTPLMSAQTPTANTAVIAQADIDISKLVRPGGTVAYDSAIYIKRAKFDAALDELHRTDDRTIVTLTGARQTGKSTFATAIKVRALEKNELRVSFVDFQSLEPDCFRSSDALWNAVVSQIAYDLNISMWNNSEWIPGNPSRSVEIFLKNHLFSNKEKSRNLLLCLDEVDTARDTGAAKFFSQVRAFYNKGASEPHWRQIRWLLSTSTEPSALIKGPNESPFNIGMSIELNRFELNEVTELTDRHGLISSVDPVRILDYYAGQPLLTHLVLYEVRTGTITPENLWDPLGIGFKIFRAHLERYLMIIRDDLTLYNAMKSIANGNGCDDAMAVLRLEALGLAIRVGTVSVVPACKLYGDYFTKTLT